jgi:hypothetical protein
MNDIFAHWKEQRFIIAPDDLVDNEKLVILTDYNYWADNTDELIAWCQARNIVTQGMTVVFPNDVSLTEFVLRWS